MVGRPLFPACAVLEDTQRLPGLRQGLIVRPPQVGVWGGRGTERGPRNWLLSHRTQPPPQGGPSSPLPKGPTASPLSLGVSSRQPFPGPCGCSPAVCSERGEFQRGASCAASPRWMLLEQVTPSFFASVSSPVKEKMIASAPQVVAQFGGSQRGLSRVTASQSTRSLSEKQTLGPPQTR